MLNTVRCGRALTTPPPAWSLQARTRWSRGLTSHCSDSWILPGRGIGRRGARWRPYSGEYRLQTSLWVRIEMPSKGSPSPRCNNKYVAATRRLAFAPHIHQAARAVECLCERSFIDHPGNVTDPTARNTTRHSVMQYISHTSWCALVCWVAGVLR